MRLLVDCLLLVAVVLMACEAQEEYALDSPDADADAANGVDQADDGGNESTEDSGCVDSVASVLCDICQDLNVVASKVSCCENDDSLYQCERIIMSFLPSQENEEFGDFSNGYGDEDYEGEEGVEKRAAWTWKKPVANRLNQLPDLGFRGKRGWGYSWKPANYRMAWYDDVTGYPGKRVAAMPLGSEAPRDYDVMEKRGAWNWKPAAYRLDDPYKFDRLGYFGKRSGDSETLDLADDADFEDETLEDVDKRAFYPARQDWKPAPYRMDPMWGLSGKRTLWSNRRPAGRYDWKPTSEYGEDDLEKRGKWDWKPSTYRLNNLYRNNGLSYIGKRFSLGLGRWNWKPQPKSRYATPAKRGRYDWKPSTGYFGFDFSNRGGQVLGKRPRTQFDWKPSSDFSKRDRYTQSWKPWKPAAYRMPNSWYGKKK